MKWNKNDQLYKFYCFKNKMIILIYYLLELRKAFYMCTYSIYEQNKTIKPTNLMDINFLARESCYFGVKIHSCIILINYTYYVHVIFIFQVYLYK